MTNQVEQYELIPMSVEEKQAQEIKILKDGLDNLRKSFFARHVDLCSIVSSLQKEVEILKDKLNQ